MCNDFGKQFIVRKPFAGLGFITIPLLKYVKIVPEVVGWSGLTFYWLCRLWRVIIIDYHQTKADDRLLITQPGVYVK